MKVEQEPTPQPAPAKKGKPIKGKNKRSTEMLSSSLLSKKIKDDPLDDILDELEVTLLESDVAYPVVQEIIVGVRNNLAGKKYGREYSLEEVVELAVKEAVSDVLQINVFDFDAWLKEQKKPTIVMFIGINGTGKTTAIAKIANRLKNEEYSVVMAACDTFRAGAIEQLNVHAEKLNVKIVKSVQDADPASVAYDAIEHARSKMKDVVLIDTAGRMQTNNNLIAEMKKIVKVAKPDLKIFVGDSLAGNDAIEQAKVFDDAVGIDAIILTKIDTDAKGGAALSIAKTIGKPIAFVCNGQEYKDIEKFDADWMLERLFDQAEA
ncbi:MAG: signal recognition particle-docking protein FtsY [archaeon]|nr:signal recognition particle-docking protein FtsY [archaeon]